MPMESPHLQHAPIIPTAGKWWGEMLTFRARSGLQTGVITPPTPPTPTAPAFAAFAAASKPDTIQPGQIRRSQPPDTEPRLVLVTDTSHTGPDGTGLPVVTARLLTNEIDLATGDEDFLPADHTPRPTTRPQCRPVRGYHLLAHKFPLYLNPDHLSPTLSHAHTLLPLTDPAVPMACRAPLPPAPDSPRWKWQLAELHTSHTHTIPLCCLFGECDE